MIQRFVFAFVFASISLLFTSFAGNEVRAQSATSQKAVSGWNRTTTKILGVDGNILLANDDLLKKSIRRMIDPENKKEGYKIKDLISGVRKENSGTGGRILRGLGGAYAQTFLDAAEIVLNTDCIVSSTTYGKIIDYEYLPSSVNWPSSANWKEGSGRLHVITMVETLAKKPANNTSADCIPSLKREAFKWEITVGPGGFSVREKQSGGDQPFPGTLDFSQEMKTRVEMLGFEYKLWAKGTAISIDKISYAGIFDQASWNNPSAAAWVEIPKTGAGDLHKYQGLYEIDDASCIDMMFVPFERSSYDPVKIPTTMSELRGPPFYCLGRCADPKIINTR